MGSALQLVVLTAPVPAASVTSWIDNQLEAISGLNWDIWGPALTIVVVLSLSFLALRFLSRIVHRLVQEVIEREGGPQWEAQQRARTLVTAAESIGRVLIVIIAIMTVLSNVGVELGPMIAGAGIVGIAVGLGAQSLIRDFISGFLILFEDQYGVGDVIEVQGREGTVEILNLRRTCLRQTDGSLVTIPNGEIRIVSNMTKEWSRALVDVEISNEDNLDHALEVLQQVLNKLDDDPKIGQAVLGPPDILAVSAMGPFSVTVRVMIKTLPGEQWRVTRELRRWLRSAFADAGLRSPYPQSIMYVRSPEDMRNAAATTAAMLSQSVIQPDAMNGDNSGH